MSDGMQNLVSKIESARIKYPDEEGTPAITGGPFIVYFEDSVRPVDFCEQVSTPDDPWQMFGVSMPLSHNYRKLCGTLIHVEDGEVAGASEITLEIKDEWMRVYVPEDSSPTRVADFLHAVDDEFGIETTEFADEHTQKATQ